jgi:hypothetical protein
MVVAMHLPLKEPGSFMADGDQVIDTTVKPTVISRRQTYGKILGIFTACTNTLVFTK